ncbi:MAG: hypothetical protein A2117_00230 [Candidatus Wildermuthbacteria bacterium GWA2_46_15]|uniref:Glycosyltransferase RgtA/B/C/D-like domain-containing protein n=1 Tax=Candidatus Wildermuthbacteria bacterium GWA2_46_15 TaxID=1802443 RepID=A0A1G2QNK4_9BACT|nr:MAG: hypothetical protein A2117_00230 [Candidatus Wildermuthbacteria bacterium GWA2_46_15]
MIRKQEIILLILILLIAGALRFWQLDTIPPGLYPDVAMNGNDALDALKSGNFKPFYPENNGREGLFINLIALSFLIFGPSVWTIKIVAAIIGILTVFGFYLLVKEVFRLLGPRFLTSNFELLAVFLLATSFWHLNFSRFGFRAIMVPFFLVWAFYLLFLGLRQKKLWPVIIAGAVFGLGFHTYIAFRVAPLILPFLLIPYWLSYRKENLQKKYLLLVTGYLLSVFIIALPIGLYFLTNPQDFIGRATGVSVFSSANPILEFAKSLFVHLQMFVFAGDSNWRHNLPGWPQLAPGLGVLMFLGLFLVVRDLIRGIRKRKWREVAVHGFLLSWFFALLLPGALTLEGIPHALRTIGVIPVAYIFVAVAVFWFYQLCSEYKVQPSLRRFGAILVLAAVVFLGFFDTGRYFFVWAKNPNVEGAFTVKYVQIADHLNSLPEETQKYVIVNESGVPVPYPDGIPMPSQTIMFLERAKFGKLRAVYLKPEELDKIKIDGRKTVIVLMKEDNNLAERVKNMFPDAKVITNFQ